MLANDRVAKNLMVSDWRRVNLEGPGLGRLGCIYQEYE
jgi:hypothetical protein